jgi:hypothetical protein
VVSSSRVRQTRRDAQDTAPPLDSTCAVKGVDVLQVRILPGELSIHPGSYGDGWQGQPSAQSSPERSPIRSGCNLTGRNSRELRVNPERLSWMPTGFGRWEGCKDRSRQSMQVTGPSAGGRGGGMPEETSAQHGRPTAAGLAAPRVRVESATVGVGGVHSTCEAGESRWREGALVLVCFRRRRGSGRLA